MALLHSDHPGPINVGNPHELTILELAVAIRELTGSASPIGFVPAAGRRPRASGARTSPWPVRCWAGSRRWGSRTASLRTIAWFRESAASVPDSLGPDPATAVRLVAAQVPGPASASA